VGIRHEPFLYGALLCLEPVSIIKGVHIRADFLYRNFKVKTQGIVDTACIFILFSRTVIFLYMTTGFVQNQS
jgi:TRAP-type mannitol/chloroaromatic compound transport system permease small subunit